MKLTFQINPTYLLFHTLSIMSNFSSTTYREDIIDFQNYAWGKSSEYYDILIGRISMKEFVIQKSLRDFWEHVDWNKVDDYIQNLQESEEFKKVLEQTQSYLLFCKTEWEKHYEVTSSIVQELSGLSFNKDFTIFITHPSLRNGINYGNNIIGWGHSEDWLNYTVVYLWHEILHSYFTYSDLDHVLIQFITDEELRTRLNGGSYPPFIGHDHLRPLSKKVLPYWREYIHSEKKNICQFKEKLKKENVAFL